MPSANHQTSHIKIIWQLSEINHSLRSRWSILQMVNSFDSKILKLLAKWLGRRRRWSRRSRRPTRRSFWGRWRWRGLHRRSNSQLTRFSFGWRSSLGLSECCPEVKDLCSKPAQIKIIECNPWTIHWASYSAAKKWSSSFSAKSRRSSPTWRKRRGSFALHLKGRALKSCSRISDTRPPAARRPRTSTSS